MYVILQNRTALEAWQNNEDRRLNYPEPLESLRYIGSGVFAPKELGRAMHFAFVETDQTGTKFALPLVAQATHPGGGTVVEKLPDDWWPVAMMTAASEVRK